MSVASLDQNLSPSSFSNFGKIEIAGPDAAAFLDTQTLILTARMSSSETAKPPVPENIPQGVQPARAAAFVDLCQMLLASNEFLYIN